MNEVFEVNFDTLVGPTHNYSGLSADNLACLENENLPSNPKEAALQGLKKMKFLADLGIKQVVLPPQERPLIHALEQLGFFGKEEDILKTVSIKNSHLLSACSSSAYMWTANAATCTPSMDSLDKKFHLTPANLVNEFHRTIEVPQRAYLFKNLFKDSSFFRVHPPLKASSMLADEGAANHTRLCPNHASQGLHFFVYGRIGLQDRLVNTKQFYPRQTLEASQAIARFHQIPPSHTFFAEQNPEAIDHGVFHNDVICFGNENMLLYHEKAFVNTESVIGELKELYYNIFKQQLICIQVPDAKISLQEAVKTYFFNSQLITLSNHKKILIIPQECERSQVIAPFIKELQHNYPEIESVQSFDLSQSMRNGGGPACLRLRIVLTDEEIATLPPSIFMNDKLHQRIEELINTHYRDQLYPSELSQISLLNESRIALQKLYKILDLNFS